MSYLYACLHCLLRSVYAMVIRVTAWWRVWRDEYLPISARDPRSLAHVTQQTRHLPRIPSHVALLPPIKSFTEVDLVRLARWASAVPGLKQVSVFYPTQILPVDLDQLAEALEEVSSETGQFMRLVDLTQEKGHRERQGPEARDKDEGKVDVV